MDLFISKNFLFIILLLTLSSVCSLGEYKPILKNKYFPLISFKIDICKLYLSPDKEDQQDTEQQKIRQ